jgi:hypothetical protein
LAKAYGIKCGAIGNILGERIKEPVDNFMGTQWEHQLAKNCPKKQKRKNLEKEKLCKCT